MSRKKLTADELFKLAFENHKKNNLQDAENLYKDVIKQKPNHVNSLFYLGGLLAQKKNFNKAKNFFEKVVKISPEHPNANNNLVSVYRMLANIASKNGNLLEAKNFFEKALNINPNNQEIAHGYGILLLKLNEHIKGLNYIKKATGFIRFTPESYQIIY